jgi:hypothetical protein
MSIEAREPEEISLLTSFTNDLQGLHPHMTPEEVQYAINISMRYKYIFVETPKCCCSTIKLTLQRLELGDLNFNRGNWEEIHVRTYSPLLGPQQVGAFRSFLKECGFLKFCFVRNPYTRLLSAYLDKIVPSEVCRSDILCALEGYRGTVSDRFVTFSEFVSVICDQPVEQMNMHWRPQYFVTMQDLLEYDFIGRFENFDGDFTRIGEMISGNFSDFILSEKRHATHADTLLEGYLTVNLKRQIYRKYKQDFEHFGYPP